MAQLPVPQIRTSIGDPGQYMQAAAVNIAGVRQAAGDIIDRYNYEEKMALAAKEREDRLAQQAIDNKRAEAMLKMQQNQEQRAIDALAKTDATQKATLAYANELGNYGRDVVTEAGAEDLLAKYKAGKDVQDEYNKKIAAYNASPEMKRDVLNQLAVPTEMDGKVVDPTMLLNMKNTALKGQQEQLDTINQQKFQASQTDKQIAANRDLAALNKAAQKEIAAMQIGAANSRFDKEKSWEEKKLALQQQLAVQQKMNDQKLWDYSAYTGADVGNPKAVAGFIKDAKDNGYSDYLIQKALKMAPKGDSVLDFGNPDVDIEVAKDYLNTYAKEAAKLKR